MMEKEIEKYIQELADDKNIIVDKTTNLFENGVLDSFGIIQLLIYIDEKVGIKINLETLDADSFKNINSIIEYLQSIDQR